MNRYHMNLHEIPLDWPYYIIFYCTMSLFALCYPRYCIVADFIEYSYHLMVSFHLFAFAWKSKRTITIVMINIINIDQEIIIHTMNISNVNNYHYNNTNNIKDNNHNNNTKNNNMIKTIIIMMIKTLMIFNDDKTTTIHNNTNTNNNNNHNNNNNNNKIIIIITISIIYQ